MLYENVVYNFGNRLPVEEVYHTCTDHFVHTCINYLFYYSALYKVYKVFGLSTPHPSMIIHVYALHSLIPRPPRPMVKRWSGQMLQDSWVRYESYSEVL